MSLLKLAILIWVMSGILALLLQKNPRWSSWVGTSGALAGCGFGLCSVIIHMFGHPPAAAQIPLHLPFGPFYIELDALSALFLIPILGLSGLAALYGTEYLKPWRDKKPLGTGWFFYNILTASMVMVVLARNGFLFLLCWEIMSVSSFFLVTFEDEKKSVRDAGRIYLVASHVGTACLLVIFAYLGQKTGSFDFRDWNLPGTLSPLAGGIIFVLALIGFGTKAGIMPFHIWLPDAHPAAPSHVSAVMSGAMIKTGIYGLVRLMSLMGVPPLWWGILLIVFGSLSGILGVLFALAQHDLKRLLAYHSVENIGIITLGLGIGVMGLSLRSPSMVVLGFTGGLLHVINHAFFKGLLFLGAGSIQHQTGTLNLDRLGGLYKRMPWTGSTFLIGSAAIAGLPPLNGFISEFLIFAGAVKGIMGLNGPVSLYPVFALISLSLIGGLALACFTKAFGIIFLGEARSDHLQHVHEVGPAMMGPMVLLGAGCLGIGLAAPFIVGMLRPVLNIMSRLTFDLNPVETGLPSSLLRPVVGVSVVLILSGLILAIFRRRLLSRKPVQYGATWDCGYIQPSPRMQYTASSFAQPLTSFFGLILQSRKKFQPPTGIFPGSTALATHTSDVFKENLFRFLYNKMKDGLLKLRWIQHGQLQAYILYIGLTLLLLLIWDLR